MSDVPLLLVQVTVHRGQFWFHDNESFCYSINPETAHAIAFHTRMLARSMKEDERSFTLGPFRITKRLTAIVELPLRTPSRGTQQPVSVSPIWIQRMEPLIVKAFELHQEDQSDSFTLVLDELDRIVRTVADRRSIPPQKE